MKHAGIASTLVFGLAVLGAVPVQADPLPGGSTFVQCSADGNSAFDAAGCVVGGIPGVPSFAEASATLTTSPRAVAAAVSPVAGVFGAGSSAEAFYFFQVTGGNAGNVVPILIDVNLTSLSTVAAIAMARVLVSTSAMSSTFVKEVCTDGTCGQTTFSGTLNLQARSGSTTDSVTLFVTAHADPTHVSTESASATADPYIYVDPTFANAGLYSIVVSPGAGNVPVLAVPEPPTWALWLLAGGVLAARRRRRAAD